VTRHLTTDVLTVFDAPAGDSGGVLRMVGAVALFFAVFYFTTIRPQRAEMAKRDDMLRGVAKDDLVVTTSGIHGKVVEVAGDVLVIEVSEKTRIRFERSAVARKVEPAAAKP
jgi:preprotein translocase subunit YajC